MGHDTALLHSVADTLTRLPYDNWNFGDSVAFEGLIAAGDALGDDRYLAFVHGWMRSWGGSGRPLRRLDVTAPGRAMVELYRRTEDVRLLETALRLADYLCARPRLASGLFATWEHSPLRHPAGTGSLDLEGARWIADPPPGAFIDCLHFDPPFFTALGFAADRPELIDEGIRQAVGYIDRLQQADGLFDHFELAGVERTFGPGWGRGQGWALLGLLDVAVDLRASGRSDTAIEDSARRLIAGMLPLQRRDGHWPIDVRNPDTGDEYSTAAFMAVGFRRALRLGLVLDVGAMERVAAAADRAEAAVFASTTTGGGLPVSAAVMACTTDSHYENVPTGFIVPWGQGPLALLLAEGTENGH